MQHRNRKMLEIAPALRPLNEIVDASGVVFPVKTLRHLPSLPEFLFQGIKLRYLNLRRKALHRKWAPAYGKPCSA